jgi:hypothetical protein
VFHSVWLDDLDAIDRVVAMQAIFLGEIVAHIDRPLVNVNRCRRSSDEVGACPKSQ